MTYQGPGAIGTALLLLPLALFAQEARPDRATPDKPTAEKGVEAKSTAETSPDKERSEKQLKIMQDAIDACMVRSGELKDSQLKFGGTPVQRYNDPTRNLLDAGVWRLGEKEKGRPTAYVTMELYGTGENRALLTYEFVSLATLKYSMASSNGVNWQPAPTDLKVKLLTRDPAPAATDKQRLLQLKQLARRFKAEETLGTMAYELRLLPQPIDRYQSPDEKIVDGAVFVYANGTNPELGLILETDGQQWNYGIFRLAAAKLTVKFDDKPLDEIPANAGYGWNRNYTAMRYAVQLP